MVGNMVGIGSVPKVCIWTGSIQRAVAEPMP